MLVENVEYPTTPIEIGDYVLLKMSIDGIDGALCEVRVTAHGEAFETFVGTPVVWDPRILVPTVDLPDTVHFHRKNVFRLQYGYTADHPASGTIPLTVHGPDATGRVELRVMDVPVITFNGYMLDVAEMVSVVHAALLNQRAKRALMPSGHTDGPPSTPPQRGTY
jgi:hypothetical protein